MEFNTINYKIYKYKAGHKPGSVHLKKRWAIIYLGLELLLSLKRHCKEELIMVIKSS